jgi:TM2 domain-containing membrane protein YozV
MGLVTCAECGKEVRNVANICPICGFKSGKYAGKSKALAIVLAIFLGGLGIHKFYLRRFVLGFLYLIFFWTLIPILLGLIDAIVLATKNKSEFSGSVRAKRSSKRDLEQKAQAALLNLMRADLRSALERDGVKAEHLSQEKFSDIEEHLPKGAKVLCAHDNGKHILLNTGILKLELDSTSSKTGRFIGAELIPFSALAKVSVKTWGRNIGILIHKNEAESSVLDFSTGSFENAQDFAEKLYKLIPASSRKPNLREDYARLRGFGPDYVPGVLEVTAESYIPADSKVLFILGDGHFMLLDNGVLRLKLKVFSDSPYGGAEFVPFSQIRGVSVRDRNPGYSVDVRIEEGTVVIAGSSFKTSDFWGLTDSKEEALKFQGMLLSLMENSSPNASSSDNTLEKIGQLKQLLDSGAITQDEFDEKKKKLMDSI